MKRLLTFALWAALFALVAVALAETVRTAVKETQGRSGPGSYYELKVLIPQGSTLEVLEKQKSWYKVKYQDQEVWVSVNSLAIEPAAADSVPVRDQFESLPMDDITVRASPATMTAAIKGFWTRYSRMQSKTLTELPVDGFDVSIPSYQVFVQNRLRESSRDKLWEEYQLPRPRPRMLTYEREHSIGYAIASSIADAPLVTDPGTIQYVHSVGWYVAESTEGYDTPFTFYILDTDRINAVSCPGGYVVLTRGLLELLGDESELAALIAHEMAHVIAGHAMQSMEESEVSIRADSAFDLLARETGTTETEEDLIGITNRAVSIATSPKLDEQEYEADRMALLYLARSGYDLGGLTRMLTTMMTIHERNIDIFDLNYRNHPDFGERLKRIEQNLREYRRYQGRTYRDEFARSMNR
ncbi:M48 family metalloprotease [Candidatus Latescibacterota bacterium]